VRTTSPFADEGGITDPAAMFDALCIWVPEAFS
jgi:hypothetical protein